MSTASDAASKIADLICERLKIREGIGCEEEVAAIIEAEYLYVESHFLALNADKARSDALWAKKYESLMVACMKMKAAIDGALAIKNLWKAKSHETPFFHGDTNEQAALHTMEKMLSEASTVTARVS